ncbi:MAG: GNAT family N-acetyltransferase [Rhodothermales bacterium]
MIFRTLTLADGTVVLMRHHGPDDAPKHFEAVRASIPELKQWMPWCHADYALADSEAWVASRPEARENGEVLDFVLIDPLHDKLLGSCGLNTFDYSDKRASMGYWVRSDHAGRGLATAAARALAEIGLQELHLNRIEIQVAVDNIGSQRVAEKIGAVREGVARNRMLVEGQVHDAVIYSLIPGDLDNER